MLPRRTSLVALTALAVIAAGGCSADGDAAPVASGFSSGSPTTPASTAPTTIPASAFLEVPANMRNSDRTPAEGSEAVPKLCGGELAAGAGAVASATMKTLYKGPDDPEGSVPHGVLFQTIRSYGGDSAAAFMDRLTKGLAGCTSYRDDEATVKVKTTPRTGDADEGVTIDLIRPQTDLPGNPVEGEQTNRIVVLRFGTVVTLLYDAEYERSSSEPAIVDTFVTEATKAIRGWRG